MTKIEKIHQKGFSIEEATVNFIVYWYNEDTNQEYKVVLPELTFERIRESL